MLTIKKIVEMTDGRLLQGNPNDLITNIHFDSREVKEKALFIALTGGVRDGHHFIQAAGEQGAIAALVSQDQGEIEQQISLILVEDTETAFQKLAHAYRQSIPIPLIGVTGSNGKTTTKDMIAHLLSTKWSVFKTHGTFNNHLGVPLSLLQITEEHQLAVLEFGMNHAGEIDHLAQLAQPSISVITNVGDSHIEYLGSRENIAKAKGEILDHTDPSQFVVLNGDDPLVISQASRYPGSVYTYSLQKKADCYASHIQMNEQGSSFHLHIGEESIPCFMPLFGLHNLSNLLPAALIGRHFGLSMQEISTALLQLSISDMRFQIIPGPNHSILINDAYNASPSSMKAAVDTFEHIYPNREKVVVFGDMFELGEHAERFHLEMGHYLQGKPVRVFTIGEKAELISKAAGGTHFSSKEEGAKQMKTLLNSKNAILFKASRGMKFENLIDALLKD